MRLIFCVVLSALAVNGQQPQQKRDLTVKDVEPPKATSRNVAPPRSYALIVGIGKYQHLSEKEALLFTERDAESIYSILISPEGGNFRAENVHRLIGPRATLAKTRYWHRREPPTGCARRARGETALGVAPRFAAPR